MRKRKMWFLLVLAWLPSAAAQESFDPARLMPSTVIAYTELAQPKPILDVLLDPRWREIAAALPQAQAYYQSEEYQQLLSVVQLVESRMGEKWPEAVRGLLDGGVYFGIDPLARGAILIVRARDAQTLKKAHDTAIELIEARAKERGEPSPVKSAEYKGVMGWSLAGEGAHALLDNLLVISNKSDGVKFVVDRYQSQTAAGSLSTAADFQQARKLAMADGVSGVQGWGMLRIAPLKLLPGVSEALSGPRDNPAAEYLLGGVFEALKHAPFVVWSHGVAEEGLALRARVPYDAAKVAENRRWFFAADINQSAAAPLRPPGTLATFTAYRDLAGMWSARDELFEANIAQNFSLAESQLSLFFSGQDFTTDFLEQMSPRTRWVVARQKFTEGGMTPGIKLPAFATVVEMNNPDEFSTKLLIGYQKLVGLLNIAGSIEQDLPSLIMDTETHDGATIHRAQYVPRKGDDPQHAELVFNFSPSCARVGNYFVLGSTTTLVKDLIAELKKPRASATTRENLLLELDLAQGAEALMDNLDTLIAQNMLEEGLPREQAERNVQLVLRVMRQMKSSHLRLTHGEEALTLELAFGLPKPEQASK